MHFSIPDTQELIDENGSAYTSFDIHINGVFHCSARFSLLYSFHEQLKKHFGAAALPLFPPKKLLAVTGPKLVERRQMLERYIQIVHGLSIIEFCLHHSHPETVPIWQGVHLLLGLSLLCHLLRQPVSQDGAIANSDIFNGFLLSAQQVVPLLLLLQCPSLCRPVYLTSGLDSFPLPVQTSVVDFWIGFLPPPCADLYGRLLDQVASNPHFTSTWETQKEQPENVSLDVFLMNGHKIAINIISTDQSEDVLEAVASQIDLPEDIVYYFRLYLVKKDEDGEHSIVRKLQDFESPFISLKSANKDSVHRIVLRKSYWDSAFDEDLLDNKVAMNLLYVQAVSDVERQWVLATNEQLKHLSSLQQKGSKREYLRLARTLKHYGYIQFHPCIADYPQTNTTVLAAAGNRELVFRVQVKPVMENGNDTILELSFEYLVAKDTLQWIIVQSQQAILISMCLQEMVEELIMKKQDRHIKKPSDRVKRTRTALQKENSIPSGLGRQMSADEGQNQLQKSLNKPVSKFSDLKLLKGTENGGPVKNTAFDSAIGDDDL